jgi:hypothetical protein
MTESRIAPGLRPGPRGRWPAATGRPLRAWGGALLAGMKESDAGPGLSRTATHISLPT